MLNDLYQEVILDHCKRPRNFHKIENADCHADGYNPLCGDKLSLFVKMDGDRVGDIAFVGSGCAISTASASLMTETMKGKTLAEAEALAERFHTMLTTDKPAGDVGKLAVFSGVKEFPARVKCATLAWHTLRAALHGDTTASTELA